MIIAYHAIFTTYGTWLPNDPRGSYSKEVYNAELSALGEIKYGRQSPQPNRRAIRRFHTAARPRLARKPHYIDDTARPIVAGAFGRVVERLDLPVRACAIMNDHVHLLVMSPSIESNTSSTRSKEQPRRTCNWKTPSGREVVGRCLLMMRMR